jgi:hypothetical protein
MPEEEEKKTVRSSRVRHVSGAPPLEFLTPSVLIPSCRCSPLVIFQSQFKLQLKGVAYRHRLPPAATNGGIQRERGRRRKGGQHQRPGGGGGQTKLSGWPGMSSALESCWWVS